eukprot:sb/3463626/
MQGDKDEASLIQEEELPQLQSESEISESRETESIQPSPSPSPPADNILDTSNHKYDVNDAIELSGWGLYQQKVLVVMGLMSFSDCAEIWLAVIILNNLTCEWDLTDFEEACIPAVVYIFYALGSVTSGYLADKFGRFWVLMINNYFLVAASIGSALSNSFYFFLVTRGIAGFCIGGNYGCSLIYAQEVIPTQYRAWNMLCLDTFWIAGSAFECIAAILVMNLSNGWRYQILLTALPVVICLVALHWIDESPRYLVTIGKKDKGKEVLDKMCRENGVEPPQGDLYVVEEMGGELWEVWAPPLTRGSIQITLHFLCNMYMLYGVSMLIPDMMSYNYCGMDTFFDSTYINLSGCEVYTDSEYWFLLVMVVIYLPGMIGATVVAEKIGRKVSLQINIFAGLVFTLLMLICIDTIVTYITVFIVVFFYAAYNQVLWIYTPEFYPTYIRGTAIGVQNGLGKLGAAAGVFLTVYYDAINIRYSIGWFVLVNIIACCTIVFMSDAEETVGKRLRDGRDLDDMTQGPSEDCLSHTYGSIKKCVEQGNVDAGEQSKG